MGRRNHGSKRRETIWHVPDGLWSVIEPILAEYDPPATTGRPRTDLRKALDGMVYRMRTGCQWNHLPAEFGDDSSVHRTLQRWGGRGVFERVWKVIVGNCDQLDGVDWEWQSADAAMGKARWGGTSSDRVRPIVRRTA